MEICTKERKELELSKLSQHTQYKKRAIDETYECFYDYWHLHSYSEDLYKL
jgi:hypothetical protein